MSLKTTCRLLYYSLNTFLAIDCVMKLVLNCLPYVISVTLQCVVTHDLTSAILYNKNVTRSSVIEQARRVCFPSI